ncbi:hypothetical protein P3G55_08145 [Leptospira sp. 96542]|nr:hypothetical protein [Leptospira sp. 96542]
MRISFHISILTIYFLKNTRFLLFSILYKKIMENTILVNTLE